MFSFVKDEAKKQAAQHDIKKEVEEQIRSHPEEVAAVKNWAENVVQEQFKKSDKK